MIDFEASKGIFHLHNAQVSYVLQLVRGRYLLHRYWGRAIRHFDNARTFLPLDRANAPQPAAYANERTFSLDVLPQEYPDCGHGDFRIPAFGVCLPDGTTVTELFYDHHNIAAGKPALAGLPATYAQDAEAETLVITLEDSAGKLSVELQYTIFRDLPIVTRAVRFKNNGTEPLDLTQAASCCVTFPDHDFERLVLYGGHAAERSLERRPLGRGVEEMSSRRGMSSHQTSPFLALARPETTEQQGEVYGINLVWSGDFALRTEVEQFGTTRVVAGLNDFEFSWHLAPGEVFQTPEAWLCYSAAGLNGMSQAFHRLIREHLVRGKYQHALRPILVNNWEATYFAFDEAKIDNLAACAADLGLEMLVLDDGWFGHRNDDNTSLGDWQVNLQKLPHGLAGVAESAHKRGLKFGLWFEPEMISVDSALYRAHPDWALQVRDYPNSFGRNQLVLDLTRPEVRDYIVDSVSAVLRSAPIDYVKWDFNRSLTEAHSLTLPAERQGETRTRFILGTYDIMERITSAFLDILFESCAGGGGRFDAGMFYYMPQAWCSDDTDAVQRQRIQSGTSLVYPPITMGAHVSVTPNHQLGRVTPLQTRAFTAMLGCYGYELDITRMSEVEKAEVRKHVELYKRLRPTLQLGTFYRLLTPFAGTGNETAWEFISEDGHEAVVMYFKTLAEPACPIRILRLAGLTPDARYRVTDYWPAQGLSHDNAGVQHLALTGQSYGGDELLYSGLTVEKVDTDFGAWLWVLRREE